MRLAAAWRAVDIMCPMGKTRVVPNVNFRAFWLAFMKKSRVQSISSAILSGMKSVIFLLESLVRIDYHEFPQTFQIFPQDVDVEKTNKS